MRQCSEYAADHLLYILVCKSLLVVLEGQADSVLLLAGRYLVPAVYVEEDNLAQELFLGSQSRLADIRERDVLVQQQSQVTADFRVLRQFTVLHLFLEIMLDEQTPVDLSRKHGLLDVQLPQTGLGNRTQHDQCLAGSGHRVHEAVSCRKRAPCT